MEGEPIQYEISELIKVHKSTISRKLRRNRGKCHGSNNRRGQIKDRVTIEERPEVIGRLGGAVLVTLAERKTRSSILALAPAKLAKAVKDAIIGALQPDATHVHTITYDNGKKFSHHTDSCLSPCLLTLTNSANRRN